MSRSSNVVVLCAQTFDVIKELARRGLLELGEDVMDAPVVIGSDELVDTGVAYFAALGTPMPSLDVAMKDIPEGFKQLTPTELLRMDPRNHVLVRVEAEDGSLVAEYDAAVSGRQTEDERIVWRALVAGSITYEVTCGFDGEQVASVDTAVSVAESTTNLLALDEARFERDLYSSTRMVFVVAGTDFFGLDLANATDEEQHAVDVSIDSLGDLVAIEDITRQEIPFASGEADPWQRAELRRTRLLWEGHVVAFTRGPLSFARSPMPSSSATRTAREVLVVPGREPFVAWVPERATVEDDTDLVHPAPWGLSHFDSSPVFGSEWTAEQGLTM